MNALTCPELPREKLLTYGAEKVTSPELLALILGTGRKGCTVVPFAQSIIDSVGGLARLARTPPRELLSIPGVGDARAARIAAAFHLSQRVMESAVPGRPLISPEDIYNRVRTRLAGLEQEVFIVFPLDANLAVAGELEIARGCLTHVEVHPREIFRGLLRHAAAAAVVAHNHPSGDPEPSRDDILLTRRLRAAGELLGIPVLDHVVVSRGGYTSIAARLGFGIRDDRLDDRE